jgi:hypothetical protein
MPLDRLPCHLLFNIVPSAIYVENCRRVSENNDMYSSLSSGEKYPRLTVIVLGGRPRSSARSILVRLQWERHISVKIPKAMIAKDIPQHASIEQDLKLFESVRSRPLHTVLLDRGQDLVVPVAGVLHRRVTAIVTISFVAELPVERFAWTPFAVVEGEG